MIFGKQVGGVFYWHWSRTASQPREVQAAVALAESVVQAEAGKDYHVVKYIQGAKMLSLLCYPGFFEEPFPVLKTAWAVDLIAKTCQIRRYDQSQNPPILHRKELFLPEDHPRLAEYRALTEAAEQLGLFENTRIIGFQQTWQTLIAQRGYEIVGHTLVPIGNDETSEVAPSPTETPEILRYRTALSRDNLSAPVQALARFGFLDGSKSFFDYGCGKGDDVRNLRANQIVASGWDPYFAPNEPTLEADIVNLGFVINVIEDSRERLQALQGAYSLAKELLVVSAMLYNQNSFKGTQHGDGVVTQRQTFQKYFTQLELKQYIDASLKVESIAVAPGIFFVFRDATAEQRFLLRRHGSHANHLRLSLRERAPAQPSVRDEKRRRRLDAVAPLRERWLSLGRMPHQGEVEDLVSLYECFDTLGQALRFVEAETEKALFLQARQQRYEDLLVYFALQAFGRRTPYKKIEFGLQRDIKEFFGDYAQAQAQGRALLYRIANTDEIANSCKRARENGLGYYNEEAALILPTQNVQRLSPLLRIYVGCASLLYGDVLGADLLKIHVESGKLSLMRYDDFAGSPLPRLLERVKIKFKSASFEYFQYGDTYEPTYLYLKSRYLNEEFANYPAQLGFDEALQGLQLFDFSGHGPHPMMFRQKLAEARHAIEGWEIVRSREIPQLDQKCGQHFTYRQFIECGETYSLHNTANTPSSPETYNALYDLATYIVDPVIAYFGDIQLTYGFCSAALAKKISGRIAPKLDQHAGHECGKNGQPICARLGAAVDFLVEDEDMEDVARWVAENTPFDRLYFYGKDRPIHVSYGPEQKREFVEMRVGKSGRRVPRVR